MKKHLIALIVSTSAVVHAEEASLESRLLGYWRPDGEKTLAYAKRANLKLSPVELMVMKQFVFEFDKDKMTLHILSGIPNKDGPGPVPYKVKAVDRAANTMTLGVNVNEMKVRFEKGQIALLGDPKKGWTILNSLSKEEFLKLKSSKAEIKPKGVGEAPGAGAVEDVSAKPIPEKPAEGKVDGKDFKVEKAILENGILKLRQGAGFFADLEFTIFLFGQNDKLDGKKITVKPNEGGNTAHIHRSRLIEKDGLPKNEVFTEKFAMKLEFGTAKDGKMPGKIHLLLPDKLGSFVAGTFEAEIK